MDLSLQWLHSQLLLQTQLLPPGLRTRVTESLRSPPSLPSRGNEKIIQDNKQEYCSLWTSPFTVCKTQSQVSPDCLLEQDKRYAQPKQLHPSCKVGFKWIEIPVLWFASCKYLTFLVSGSVCKNDHHLIGCVIAGLNDVHTCLAPFVGRHTPSNSYYKFPPPQREQRNQNIK